MKTIRDKRDYGCWIIGTFMLGLLAMVVWASINTFYPEQLFALISINVVWFGFTLVFIWPGPFISRIIIIDGNKALYEMKYMGMVIRSDSVSESELKEEDVMERGMVGTRKVKYLVCGNSRVRISHYANKSASADGAAFAAPRR